MQNNNLKIKDNNKKDNARIIESNKEKIEKSLDNINSTSKSSKQKETKKE